MVENWGEGNFYDFARNAVDRSRSKTAIWNGDSHSNWTGLSYSIASGIRSGLIGFSQWGSDTGGYIRDLNDPKQDLWSRWMWCVSPFSSQKIHDFNM
jgi:alpha-glucosidase (family GH31 glycosyl hydrolase)